MPRATRTPLSHAVVCATALVLGSTIGLWMLYAGPSPEPKFGIVASVEPARVKAVLPRRMATKPGVGRSEPSPFGSLSLLDPASIAATAPGFGGSPTAAGTAFSPEAMVPTHPAAPADDVATAEPAPVVTGDAPAAVADPDVPSPANAIPLPLPRPVFATPGARPTPPSSRRVAALAPVAPDPATPPAPSGFFEKMFGSAVRPPLPALAYAAPEDTGRGGLGTLFARPGPDPGTAVYNIATHTVTLPNGTKLEAHSGLGARLDDPRSVTEHMRGATPPAIYDLTLRESLFHGVQALRLTPIDPSATYGRMGLLAHTFMLGPRGDSNGCVVFRDYQAFLRAYETGQIRRLSVVTGTS